ncbi:hypothetical protein LCGC14_0612600 [marine sediment metagenome]|uniref:Uncharacterized protein n=1 Tax=marine sediment metagenome TaxID=412755 RepID=A0A0F9TTG3_9ZZZZ
MVYLRTVLLFVCLLHTPVVTIKAVRGEIITWDMVLLAAGWTLFISSMGWLSF